MHNEVRLQSDVSFDYIMHSDLSTLSMRKSDKKATLGFGYVVLCTQTSGPLDLKHEVRLQRDLCIGYVMLCIQTSGP